MICWSRQERRFKLKVFQACVIIPPLSIQNDLTKSIAFSQRSCSAVTKTLSCGVNFEEWAEPPFLHRWRDLPAYQGGWWLFIAQWTSLTVPAPSFGGDSRHAGGLWKRLDDMQRSDQGTPFIKLRSSEPASRAENYGYGLSYRIADKQAVALGLQQSHFLRSTRKQNVCRRTDVISDNRNN